MELVPVVLLPQIIFCGFFVSVDDLPSYIAWANWLMPLSYAFRLFLAEEFSTCTDFTVQEQNSLNCLLSLQKELSSTAFGTGTLYNETSVLRLYYTGTYTGREAIVEYIKIFSAREDPLSLLWNSCKVSTV
jgi:hypothetical protein